MEHGTRSQYVNGKCRCGPCREANRVYNSRYWRTAYSLRYVRAPGTPRRWGVVRTGFLGRDGQIIPNKSRREKSPKEKP